MNIRGVSFRVPQGRNDILQEILDGINVQTLFWYNVESQNEVWSVPHYKDFFKEEYYSGQDFYEQIKLPHLVIFLKLQAYSEEEPYADIHTYDEFIKSSCLLLVLIYDCESVEIFSKDERITRSLFDNAHRKGFSETTLITDENDGRTKMGGQGLPLCNERSDGQAGRQPSRQHKAGNWPVCGDRGIAHCHQRDSADAYGTLGRVEI